MKNPPEAIPQNQEPRLPQIDPVTFSALNTLDNLVGKAPLTRQEHAEANKCLQHLVQTVEMLEATVRELKRQGHALQRSGTNTGATASNGNGFVSEAKAAPLMSENSR